MKQKLPNIDTICNDFLPRYLVQVSDCQLVRNFHGLAEEGTFGGKIDWQLKTSIGTIRVGIIGDRNRQEYNFTNGTLHRSEEVALKIERGTLGGVELWGKKWPSQLVAIVGGRVYFATNIASDASGRGPSARHSGRPINRLVLLDTTSHCKTQTSG